MSTLLSIPNTTCSQVLCCIALCSIDCTSLWKKRMGRWDEGNREMHREMELHWPGLEKPRAVSYPTLSPSHHHLGESIDYLCLGRGPSLEVSIWSLDVQGAYSPLTQDSRCCQEQTESGKQPKGV